MSCRYLENVLSWQDNSKTILRCLEDVLCRLGDLVRKSAIRTKGSHGPSGLNADFWCKVLCTVDARYLEP